MNFDEYEHLRIEHTSSGVTTVTLDRPAVMNAMNERMHFEVSRLFYDLDIDDATKVVVVTGAGANFSSGGDREMVARMPHDPALIRRQFQESLNTVYGMVNCSKVIVSAIEGHALGAGLVVALLADISIAGVTARLNDGHLRIGIVAGDHAALIWPLLCGMARAKYYLLTGAFIDGATAGEIGLVSKVVESGEALAAALELAEGLAQTAPQALSWTKRSLNSWLRSAGPGFEQSLALEMLSFNYPEAAASLQPLRPPTD